MNRKANFITENPFWQYESNPELEPIPKDKLRKTLGSSLYKQPPLIKYETKEDKLKTVKKLEFDKKQLKKVEKEKKDKILRNKLLIESIMVILFLILV